MREKFGVDGIPCSGINFMGEKHKHHEWGFIFVNDLLQCQAGQALKNGFDITDKCSLWEASKGFGGTSSGNATCHPTLSRSASKEQ